MSEIRRRHVLSVEFQADDEKELERCVMHMAQKIAMEQLGPEGVSGGVGHSWTYRYSEDESVDAESYEKALQDYLAERDKKRAES